MQAGEETVFKIKKSTAFGKVFEAYAARKGTRVEGYRWALYFVPLSASRQPPPPAATQVERHHGGGSNRYDVRCNVLRFLFEGTILARTDTAKLVRELLSLTSV